MLKRTVTAVVAIAVFIPICIFSGPEYPVWTIAMTLLSLIAAYEMTKCVGAKKHVSLLVPAFLCAAAVPVLAYLLESPFEAALGVYAHYLVYTFAADVFSRGKIDYEVSAASFMGIFYISLAFACLVMLRSRHGSYRYLLVFIGPWVSDTFAYLVGRMFGKHKLIPEVSPKKTVEGAVGGIVFAALGFALYAWIIRRFFAPDIAVNLWVMALAGAVVSVISQIGDLAMSVVKRRYGIKDYGSLFPGHGGVLDRFDSVLMTAPILLILSQIPPISAALV